MEITVDSAFIQRKETVQSVRIVKAKGSVQMTHHKSALATQPAMRSAEVAFRVNSMALERTIRGRLRAVEATRNAYRTQPLTTEEFLQVKLATVREGYNHRRWPVEVLERFLAAEVLTNHTVAGPSAHNYVR